ncbi:MAG: shikimate kinase [Halioglobus sp.]|nr:shikimate kinase [Halioglobus sp.]
MRKRIDTISLIGMPGVGKSTVGVVLAKTLGLAFVDTDLCIQLREHATLQDVLERSGYRYLRSVEEAVLLSLPLAGVIATGGSVVYSDAAMRRLRAAGPVVYLQAGLATLKRRVAAAPPRGIACAAGDSFDSIFAERSELYQQQADIRVAVEGLDVEQVVQRIVTALDA